MINFTVGPVQSSAEVHEIGSLDVPYFRTQEFSGVMLENERLMLEFSGAPEGSRVVFLTGSGTAAMEASVINLLDDKDKVLVVNGGSFGQRFADLVDLHGIPHEVICLDAGHALQQSDLSPFEGKGFTALLVNLHETSTGVLYDINMIGDFCRRNGIFLIVDAISSFLADEFDMSSCGADVMITGSQKALACPPGASVVVLSPRALERVERIESGVMYFDFASALNNGERGQTPFTPAVGILLQINARLRQIERDGGVSSQVEKTAALASYFRTKIDGLPLEMFSDSMSNACTAIHPINVSARDIFLTLKGEYGIWVCPNGGSMADTVFRVGHIGELSFADFDVLVDALTDMNNRGLL